MASQYAVNTNLTQLPYPACPHSNDSESFWRRSVAQADTLLQLDARNIQQSVPKTRQAFVKLRIITMRVRVSCDASAGSLRFLLRVPRELELVADFVRHLHLRLPQQATSLVLRVGGFALLPTLRLTDVLRDDDEVCVTVTGSDERPPIQSSVPMAALPDSTAPVAPAEKRRRVRDSGDSAGKHAETPPKTQQLPPYPPVSPAAVAAVAETAKKPRRPKDAGNEDVPTPPAPAPSKARKEKQKPKVWVSAV